MYIRSVTIQTAVTVISKRHLVTLNSFLVDSTIIFAQDTKGPPYKCQFFIFEVGSAMFLVPNNMAVRYFIMDGLCLKAPKTYKLKNFLNLH